MRAEIMISINTALLNSKHYINLLSSYFVLTIAALVLVVIEIVLVGLVRG